MLFARFYHLMTDTPFDGADDTLPEQPAMRAYAKLVGRERMRQQLLECGCPEADVDRVVDALLSETE